MVKSHFGALVSALGISDPRRKNNCRQEHSLMTLSKEKGGEGLLIYIMELMLEQGI